MMEAREMETAAAVKFGEMACGICAQGCPADCTPYLFLNRENLGRIKYFLRQYRKSLQKHADIKFHTPEFGLVYPHEAKLFSLERRAQRWWKKALRAGYDHTTMLGVYHQALN
jgi:hypothetical protein